MQVKEQLLDSILQVYRREAGTTWLPRNTSDGLGVHPRGNWLVSSAPFELRNVNFQMVGSEVRAVQQAHIIVPDLDVELTVRRTDYDSPYDNPFVRGCFVGRLVVFAGYHEHGLCLESVGMTADSIPRLETATEHLAGSGAID